ncbi:MAG: 16S rRNA (cytosine(1402)-N(4))-methyltransferase RsmH [Crocinitomicaceae bacterium]|nr:16S rRNA (cytosine(1402)-N(4))-methyltransferase RsmH [Crocinitomicaceae bacterium]MDG1735513.1 16S rRNA (cytosine(1402)-N(4))-methyltransferase RsmH [Crocinitomicaceae bacterium]
MNQQNNKYHIPVLRDACIEGLDINPDGIYVDVTFGGGGHSRVIYDKLSSKGALYALDQDEDALRNVWDAPNFHFIQSNFSFLSNQLRLKGVTRVDGILADLGVSSHQFDEGARGFSIRNEGALDMRMNASASRNAADILNDCEEEELVSIFRKYGEIRNAKKLAYELVKYRQSGQLSTTQEFIKFLSGFAPKFKENRYYAQVFQAVRIEVNQEIKVLEDLLIQSEKIIAPEGRLVVLSYHSLEDRLVKNFLKKGNLEGQLEKDFFGNPIKPFSEVTRKPVIPSEDEIKLNSRARSAKLRIGERNG